MVKLSNRAARLIESALDAACLTTDGRVNKVGSWWLCFDARLEIQRAMKLSWRKSRKERHNG